MEFTDKLAAMSAKVRQDRPNILTEEATKTSLIMPFISTVLGYDVFSLADVVPEFIADVGLKKGEKIDYAIMRDGQIQILIECKKVGEPLRIENASQLFRYFHVTSARIACLTNGQIYRFYTDLDAPNKMDDRPFLELDLDDIDEALIPALHRLTKAAFDVESIINSAEELKYVSAIKRCIGTLFASPEEDLVRVFAGRVYEGSLTQRVREQFTGLVAKSFAQYISDQVNDRLRSALGGRRAVLSPLEGNESPDLEATSGGQDEAPVGDPEVDTTVEELEGYHIVRAIVCRELPVQRITQRDQRSYFAILIDDNNRKPVCRLHFNRRQKYLGLLDENKAETRVSLDTLSDIYQYSDELREAARRYL
ncbi:MAG: type I restriction enzyme HsdR N-terminal domain-containing protein [Propionibacteriales bacterium]|nr:type I restriction enzyme HsdR N-terminal domain-containing protein [Propionibacteriales bacterium]